ncbi:MAG TPA: carboxypeptidase regulatory-like domain-containing protein [Vicinamibacterales bacterium]|nr:carboxypeptidase regulatory-like domain-containing protein [Vicinamibacterales bacterium]
MRWFELAAMAGLLAFALACGGNSTAPAAAPARPAVDPATAGTITAMVKFEGEVPAAEMITITGDPKCVSENGGPQRAEERIVVGDNQALQNVFVYIKDGPASFGFPVPTEPVLLDQDKCRYTPRVVGVRVGQPLQIRNSDPLLHNVRANGVINQAFNKSTPVEGVSFTHTFATSEVMVPFKCDVHGWMSAYVGVLDHPYFGTTAADGKVVLGNLAPGTYTLEAWHESLGTRTQQITIGARESKDVSITFAR